MNWRKFLLLLQYVLWGIGILALGYVLANWIDRETYQARASRQFEREALLKDIRRSAPRVSRQPVIPEDGELLGRLEIPRLGLSVMVVEGDLDSDLKRAAGHIPGTPLPGQRGNVGIAAHRDTFFRPLRLIRLRDAITLTSLQGVWTYYVVSTAVVDPTDVQVLFPNGKNSLTLVTCFPFNYLGHAPKRFIVQALRTPA